MSIKSSDLPEHVRQQIRRQKPVAKAEARGPLPKPRMNKWEQEYSSRLQGLVAAGGVLWFAFEPMKLRLGANYKTTYTPDFLVQGADGTLEVHEVKGRKREDAMVKLKTAAGMYPFRFVLVEKDKGNWKWSEVKGR